MRQEKPKLKVIPLGQMDYEETYQLQLELLKKRYNGDITDTLLLVEHPPVFTIGKRGSEENLVVRKEFLQQEGIAVHKVDRGGDITYHGPGQLVGYPILNLKEHKQDLHWVLRSYEEVFIKVLNKFGLTAQRISGLTGVWVGDKKITALGIGVKKWITLHGFGFNINPDLKHFQYIIPCGIVDKGVTSLEKLLSPSAWQKEEVINLVIEYFGRVFEMELITNEQKISAMAQETITAKRTNSRSKTNFNGAKS